MSNLHHLDEIAFLGPPTSAGPLPALFYFSLSARDSLTLDPFNQPAAYLEHLPMRIFSLTLPGHENNLPPTQALYVWAQELGKGHDVIAAFVAKVQQSIALLLEKRLIFEDKLAVSGLSRGAFVAAHVAAAIPQFRIVLGFAPLTQVSFAQEFEAIARDPLVEALSLMHLTDRLIDRKLRFYIGNLDMRVSTRRCFDFIEKLSQTAYEQRVRSPSVELFIYPSIGHMGHGTPQAIFHQGAQWVADQLGVSDAV